MAKSISILSIQRGKAHRFRGADEFSAIDKQPVDGKVRVGFLGLAGDEQADLSVHGGPDKAIHQYPHEHYRLWREAIGDHPLLDRCGAFGENISTRGMTEETVCIGDRYRMGTALVEVSQGRQPCWKLNHRFGGLPVSAHMVRLRRCGWYYRVLEEGEAAAGDSIELVERDYAEWTVARTFGLLIAGDHKRDSAGLEALGGLDVLAEPWKLRRAKLLGG